MRGPSPQDAPPAETPAMGCSSMPWRSTRAGQSSRNCTSRHWPKPSRSGGSRGRQRRDAKRAERILYAQSAQKSVCAEAIDFCPGLLWWTVLFAAGVVLLRTLLCGWCAAIPMLSFCMPGPVGQADVELNRSANVATAYASPLIGLNAATSSVLSTPAQDNSREWDVINHFIGFSRRFLEVEGLGTALRLLSDFPGVLGGSITENVTKTIKNRRTEKRTPSDVFRRNPCVVSCNPMQCKFGKGISARREVEGRSRPDIYCGLRVTEFGAAFRAAMRCLSVGSMDSLWLSARHFCQQGICTGHFKDFLQIVFFSMGLDLVEVSMESWSYTRALSIEWVVSEQASRWHRRHESRIRH